MVDQENGTAVTDCLQHCKAPAAPNPASDVGILPPIQKVDGSIHLPPEDTSWSPTDLAPLAALAILSDALEQLATAAGDIPPTPSLKHLAVPSSRASGTDERSPLSSQPATPTPDIHPDELSSAPIPDPEAEPTEPIITIVEADANPLSVQQEMIARKFFSKTPPPISIKDYLLRLQQYCPMSTAVYLTAVTYIQKLAIEERIVPVTKRTIHRLALASLRVAMKALEDLRYPQSRFAGVGGVAGSELGKLEIALCYLLDFDLQVSNKHLHERTESLRQAAQQMLRACAGPGVSFEPKLPLRKKMNGE